MLASCSSNSWRDLNSWAQSTHEKGAYIIASISEDLSLIVIEYGINYKTISNYGLMSQEL
jgi:hypothetical protein